MEDRRTKNMKKHLVQCPHCGKEVLDHMTECYFCKGELTPKGYTPMIDANLKSKIKWIVGTILVIIAVAVFVTNHFI